MVWNTWSCSTHSVLWHRRAQRGLWLADCDLLAPQLSGQPPGAHYWQLPAHDNKILAAVLPGHPEPTLPQGMGPFRGAFGASNALSEELEAEKIILQEN